MSVLVTGGAGYIGSHVVRELADRGYEVIVLDTLERGHRALAERAGASRIVVGSTGDSALLDSLLEDGKCEAVLHFAAYKAPGESVEQPSIYFRNNFTNTMSLLDAMVRHGISSFIFSSTSAIFGQPRVVPVTEDNNPTNPESPYGESKLMVEKALRWYELAYGINSVCLRYFNAAGASFDARLGEDWTVTLNLIPLVMQAALGKREAVQVFGTDYPTPDGTCIRDYIHVVDLAAAHVSALDWLRENKRSAAYNLGTGKGNSVREVIDLAKRISGSNIRVEYVGRRAGDPAALWADSSKAQRELNWEPRYGLEEIVETAFRWHESYPNGL